ncbi:hypothetical protein HID58_032630, partial [Brassica napus]
NQDATVNSADPKEARVLKRFTSFSIFATQGRKTTAIDKCTLRGLRVLSCCKTDCTRENKKKISGGSWEFVGGLPLFDPPHTPLEELQTSVSTSMITGYQLAIAKLGMGSNMYP